MHAPETENALDRRCRGGDTLRQAARQGGSCTLSVTAQLMLDINSNMRSPVGFCSRDTYCNHVGLPVSRVIVNCWAANERGRGCGQGPCRQAAGGQVGRGKQGCVLV